LRISHAETLERVTFSVSKADWLRVLCRRWCNLQIA